LVFDPKETRSTFVSFKEFVKKLGTVGTLRGSSGKILTSFFLKGRLIFNSFAFA